MNLTEGQLFTIEALNRIDGFVWPKDANFACAFNIVNGRNFGVEFYIEKPTPSNAIEAFKGALSKGDPTKVILGQHPDWRSSLITREQFEGVDGWVRSLVASVPNDIPKCGVEIEFGKFGRKWRYRKPTKETEMQNPKPYKKRDCIETLIDKRKDAIEQKRIALSALEEAEAKERELMLSIQAWAESYGFDIRVLDESDEKPEPNPEPELVITDWRDLRVGDIIWWSGAGCIDSGEYVVSNVESNDYKGSTAFCVSCAHGLEWVSTKFEKWKFIHRPCK